MSSFRIVRQKLVYIQGNGKQLDDRTPAGGCNTQKGKYLCGDPDISFRIKPIDIHQFQDGIKSDQGEKRPHQHQIGKGKTPDAEAFLIFLFVYLFACIFFFGAKSDTSISDFQEIL
ncbi:MAG: hypothetical protein HY881_02715 [Deltaproteobacteria bacterium]|nr:hypothetical protein [Deltaproteobacteria bacterium]